MDSTAMQQTIDKQEIRDLLATYCRGIDRLDADLVASVYHDDAYDDHGTFKGSGKEFAKSVVVGLARFERTMHVIGNCLVDVDGDAARAETYCVAYHRTRAEDGPQKDFVAGVRYVDHLERRGGGPWLIAKRVVVMEWTRWDPIGEQWDAAAHFTMGRRDRTDLVYET
jgi:ketosteroid isomerase-like protein